MGASGRGAGRGLGHVQVQCPSCGTRFRVDAQQLRPEGTRARCSYCGYRFLVFPEQPPQSAPPQEPESPGSMGEPDAPEPPVPGEGQQQAEAGEAEPASLATPGPRHKRRRATRASGRRGAGRGRRAASFLLGLLVLLLVAGLAVELGYAFRAQLLAQPWVRATVQKGLDIAEVDWELPVALSRYRAEGVEARQVTLSSGRGVTLMEGSLVNTAPFAQPPPKLELRADTPGSGVGYRRIKAPGEPFQVTGEELDAEGLRQKWERARAAFPEALDPGQSEPFVVVLADLPPGSRRIQVELVR